MKQYHLSILIPARNEMFLAQTIQNILQNIEGDTEIIAVLDGGWAKPPIPDHKRLTLIYNPQSIGQRAATNQAARLSRAKYLMKCDAHCAFDKGFDIKMMREMHYDWTMAPLMKNLHAFDWICPSGHRRYQGPSGPCTECGQPTTQDILWQAKPSPNSVSYCFDSTPHFQYFREYSKRPEGQGDITETMSLQGSCWMLTRDKYWQLNICDEAFGSWGSQGIEVAVKTWLSGGRVMVNKKTWYAHMFRTQGGDFGFPYPISAADQAKAKTFARDLFFNNNWPQQKYPLSWLVEKFWPVQGWTEEDLTKLKANTFRFSATAAAVKPVESEPAASELIESEPEGSSLRVERPAPEFPLSGLIYSTPQPTRGIIFYTHNQLMLKIAHAVQRQLRHISEAKGIPIVSASLKPMSHFGVKNIYLPLERGYVAMFKQILAALENSDAEIVFMCEHDVLYHPSHFDFTPERKDMFYYNHNWWRLRLSDGLAVHWDANQVSSLCAYREHLLAFYRQRVAEVEKRGYRNQGFEPGGRSTKLTQSWKSAYANIDLKHGGNLSKNRWSPHHFHDKSTVKNFASTDNIPGWGKTTDLIKPFS